MTHPPTMPPVVLFTGKGGVGKTTVAAGTAALAADRGRRVLVASTDAAHSLGDALGVGLGAEPVLVDDGLWAVEVDSRRLLEDSWGEMRDWLVDVFDWAGLSALEAEELAVLPGMEEILSLVEVRRLACSGEWDLVVVDCAPTAETVRLLSLPDVIDWYMKRLFPMGRRVNRVVAPVLQRFTNLPVADDTVFDAVQRLHGDLKQVKAWLADPELSRVRLVVNPEAMVLAEARRTHTYLALFGYPVDAVICNKVLPGHARVGWFENWGRVQDERLAEASTWFAPLRLIVGRLAEGELSGVESLRDFAESTYGDLDPSARLTEMAGMRVFVDRGRQVLELTLGSSETESVSLARRDGHLLVTAGPYRRAIELPDTLRRRPIVTATHAGGTLRVVFGDPGRGEG